MTDFDGEDVHIHAASVLGVASLLSACDCGYSGLQSSVQVTGGRHRFAGIECQSELSAAGDSVASHTLCHGVRAHTCQELGAFGESDNVAGRAGCLGSDAAFSG